MRFSKLLMTWNIIRGQEQAYVAFHAKEFVPGLMAFGLHPVDSWFTMYGEGPQVVVGCDRLRQGGVAEAIKGGVQQHPGIVAGKRPSCAIGAVVAWRQADDEQWSLRIPERRHRPREIIRLRTTAIREKACQARAGAAFEQRRRGSHHALLFHRFEQGQRLPVGRLGLHSF